MTAAATRGVEWPPATWSAQILRGLDERGRRDVMASGELLRVNEGAVITREGEPADSLFVVVEGALRLESVRRGEASARRLRTVLVGESHGEEALLGALAVRTSRAVAEKPSTVARIPWAVLERCLVRAGGGELVERTTRTLRRAVLRDVWTTSGLVESLDDAEIGLLLDATRHVVLARGEVLLHEGERSLDAFVVIEGLVQVQQDDDGKPRPVAYLGRGDLFGDAELASGEPSSGTFAAAGESWIAAIDGATFGRVFSGREAMIARAHRVTLVGRKRPGVGTTAHAFRDVYRLQIARSLLVIDQDSCARCGHCVWSCGDAHPDGVARIVRRGDKLITGGGDGLAALLVPNSCQHCKNPSCMKECPTGAIGRDARGEVTIREDLCTGCGNCAKGCPWDNIQMAPRLVPRGEKPPAYPEVAVKCDLCSGLEGGPACVAACPTEAIARIEPEAALPALVPSASRGARSASPVPRARPAWPWIAFGASAAVALSRSAMPRVASGALSLGLVMALVAYSALKRRRPAPRRKNQGGAAAASSSSRLRPHYMAHLVLGLLLSGAVVAHGGTRVVASAGGGRRSARRCRPRDGRAPRARLCLAPSGPVSRGAPGLAARGSGG